MRRMTKRNRAVMWRRISLTAGNMFLDVATSDASDDPKFVVATPRRNITALGTEFAVSVAETGDSVVLRANESCLMVGVDSNVAYAPLGEPLR